MCIIRTLRANEIELRVQQIKKNNQGGANVCLLSYIDSRAAIKLLNETFGLNWKREHLVVDGKLVCRLSVYNNELKEWIYREDVGTESNSEKEKGQFSDSLKRCLVNFGVTELYTSPNIFINLDSSEISEYNGKVSLKWGLSFSVKEIAYNDDREIIYLVIVDNNGKVRYTFGNPLRTIDVVQAHNLQEVQVEQQDAKKETINSKQRQRLYAIASKAGFTDAEKINRGIIKKYGKELCFLTRKEYDEVVTGYEKLVSQAQA